MTDHIALAMDYVGRAKIEIPAYMAPKATIAQVHATLALVAATEAQTEQLRLANVIAWTTQAGRMPSPETRDVVAKGLGL